MRVDRKYAAESTFDGPFPPGARIWPGVVVYHGTSAEDAAAIVADGVDMSMANGGYFGAGFYVADHPLLCWTNYAGRSGGVVRLRIQPTARILDLRNERDSERWSALTNQGRGISDPGFAKRMTAAMVDGVFDRSMGGLCLFNPGAFVVDGLEEMPGVGVTSEAAIAAFVRAKRDVGENPTEDLVEKASDAAYALKFRCTAEGRMAVDRLGEIEVDIGRRGTHAPESLRDLEKRALEGIRASIEVLEERLAQTEQPSGAAP